MNIIKENKERLKILKAPYNPLTGKGSLVPRFKYLGLWLPMPMRNIPEFPIFEQLRKKHADKDALIAAINQKRIKHDFEYWAYTAIKILNKNTGKEIKFKLNYPQRKLIAELEDMRVAGVPIRIIIAKARQWGGSTLMQIYIMWTQAEHHTNWNSTIVADVESQSLNIRAMYSRAARNYPKYIGNVTLKNFEGSSKNKMIEETGSVIYIGSMQKPENIRSADVKAAHLSEIGLWKTTLTKSPKDVIQSILGSVPMLPDTVVALESTAKGVGNYFHNAYKDAKKGINGFQPFFSGWQDNINNTTSCPQEKWQEVYDSFSDYEKFLWNQGATIQGVLWYRAKLKEFEGDTWRMKSEFPTTDKEAFQSTGNRVFPIEHVDAMRANCTPPLKVGNFIADSTTDKEAMQGIRFVETPQGNTQIWNMPDTKKNVKNRYLVTVDIGGTTKDADWSVIRVFDRIGLIGGGKMKAISTTKLHADVDIVIWKAVTIATAYHQALLVIEKNSLNRKKDAGENYLAALVEIADIYPNIYKREDKEDEDMTGKEVKYGFHTNRQTKPMIVKQFKATLRDKEYIETDTQAMDEADIYEEKPDGSYGNVDGKDNHDDVLMTTMIGCHISAHVMEPPVVIEKSETRRRPTPSMADF